MMEVNFTSYDMDDTVVAVSTIGAADNYGGQVGLYAGLSKQIDPERYS
jgi:hypothetical protein